MNRKLSLQVSRVSYLMDISNRYDCAKIPLCAYIILMDSITSTDKCNRKAQNPSAEHRSTRTN